MSNPVPPTEQYINTRKVAEMFDVSPETVIEWIGKGLLPATKINGRWRILKADVIEFGKAKYSA